MTVLKDSTQRKIVLRVCKDSAIRMFLDSRMNRQEIKTLVRVASKVGVPHKDWKLTLALAICKLDIKPHLRWGLIFCCLLFFLPSSSQLLVKYGLLTARLVIDHRYVFSSATLLFSIGVSKRHMQTCVRDICTQLFSAIVIFASYYCP